MQNPTPEGDNGKARTQLDEVRDIAADVLAGMLSPPPTEPRMFTDLELSTRAVRRWIDGQP